MRAAGFWGMVMAALLCAAPGQAQEIVPVLDPGPMEGWTAGGMAWFGAEPEANGIMPKREEATGAKVVNFVYVPSLLIQRQALKGYVARLEAQRPGLAPLVGRLFTSHDPQTVYRMLTRASGLRENDAADTFTAYNLLNWMIATNTTALPSVEQTLAVRRQVIATLATNPRLADTAFRARLSEELKLSYIALSSGWKLAWRGKDAQAYSDNVAALFKQQTGQDLRLLTLTDAGFVRRQSSAGGRP